MGGLPSQLRICIVNYPLVNFPLNIVGFNDGPSNCLVIGRQAWLGWPTVDSLLRKHVTAISISCDRDLWSVNRILISCVFIKFMIQTTLL